MTWTEQWAPARDAQKYYIFDTTDIQLLLKSQD